MDLMSIKNGAFSCFSHFTLCTLLCVNTEEKGHLKRGKAIIELSLLANMIILKNTKGEVLRHCRRLYCKV